MSQNDPHSTQTGVGPVSMIVALTDAWVRATGHVSQSVVEINRAMLAASPFSTVDVPRTGSVSYDEEAWSTELDLQDPSRNSVGDVIRFSKQLTDEDVRSFASASGDTNRLHLDDEFAEATRFGGRIVHGTLVSGLISAALARLPGVTIYLSQDVQFLKPVHSGDVVTAVIEIVEDLGDGRYRLSTDVVDELGDPFLVGEAIVLIDALPDGYATGRQPDDANSDPQTG